MSNGQIVMDVQFGLIYTVSRKLAQMCKRNLAGFMFVGTTGSVNNVKLAILNKQKVILLTNIFLILLFNNQPRPCIKKENKKSNGDFHKAECVFFYLTNKLTNFDKN